jgi:colanic acid/amylovoran biosynthesis glycosyltransferase
MSASKLRVIHSTPVWLSPTMTWLHTQVRYLPETIESHVVCEKTANVDRFPVKILHSLEGVAPARRFWERATRRAGLRQHLPFLAEHCSNAELLHSHFGNVAWQNLGAAEASGVKHVVTFYGVDVVGLPRRDPRWRSRYRELFASVEAIFCEGPHMARCLVDLGAPAARVHVHHLGVELDRIRFEPRRWSPGTPLRILLAGTFREKKGLPYALDAIGLLRRRRPGFEVEITIIGDKTDEPASHAEAARIDGKIAEHGLRPRKLGFQTHARLFEEAYAHHLFVSPSVHASDGDTEGGAPVTIIELAASGMPVVSTTHCDIPNVIEHGKSGFLAPERDAEALADQIERWIDAPDQWAGLVGAARARVEAEFDAVAQGERLATLYHHLAKR